MKVHRSTLLTVAVVTALGLGACNDTRNATPSTGATTTTPSTMAPATTDRMTAGASVDRAADATANAGDKMAANAGDAATTAKVKARLMAEPGIDSLQINVDTTGGQVTLTGEVDTAQNLARAKELAGAVEGVRGVVDRLSVKRG